MVCPKCMREEFIQPTGSHYICLGNSELDIEFTGCGTQFEFVEDPVVKFPFNLIYNNRIKKEFYRVPYLEVAEE